MWVKNRLIKEESGQALVMVALLLTTLLGFSALVIDIGFMYVQKSELQNAADAAALAGAASIGELTESEIDEIIVDYIEYNTEYDSENIIEYDPTNIEFGKIYFLSTIADTTLKVDVFEQSPKFFADFVSENVKTNSAIATAQVTSLAGDAFNYALFAGGSKVIINGSGSTITGSIYGKYGVEPSKTEVINGNVETSLDGEFKNIDKVIFTNGTSKKIDEINFEEDLPDLLKERGIIMTPEEFLKHLENNNNTINEIISIEGNSNDRLEINSKLKGTGVVYYPGSIDIKDGYLPESNSVILYSEGNITFNGGSGVLYGVLYAPNGKITIHGNGSTKPIVIGRLIAQEIEKDGGHLTVTSSSSDLDALQSFKTVRLIQ